MSKQHPHEGGKCLQHKLSLFVGTFLLHHNYPPTWKSNETPAFDSRWPSKVEKFDRFTSPVVFQGQPCSRSRIMIYDRNIFTHIHHTHTLFKKHYLQSLPSYTRHTHSKGSPLLPSPVSRTLFKKPPLLSLPSYSWHSIPKKPLLNLPPTSCTLLKASHLITLLYSLPSNHSLLITSF